MVDLTTALNKHLIPDLASIVLEYSQLEHVNELVDGHRRVYTMLFGKKHGESKGYYTTGELWYSHHYVNGNRHGEYKSYYRNGELWCYGRWINSKKHGEFKEYCPTGELWCSLPYVNGKRHGESKWYYPNGGLRHSYHYVDGKMSYACRYVNGIVQ